ncbi:DUF1330 domain-containing protein [Vibrio sp. ZSDE26]|uniref:DUF1330 domain-containing protein n=1 Tax=Vibrio amylolyticus TaxID=2847292 RepID=A0A9X1XKT5_9VIBR|nr:DUF1330 domain-containing protein [Vibrio amylolyticus]MCK6264674.1 DUF1330 domain-containing protein [Vibrio amylolyticus]
MSVYYSVVEVTPTSEEWIPSYIEQVTQIVAKHGGKYLARTGSHQQMEGDRESAALCVIIEWPSKEAAVGLMEDPAYAPHFKARSEGAVNHHIFVEGKDDFA